MQKRWEVTVIWCSGFPSSIYMWTVDSESFKEPLWNVSDSHGESLLLLKCFFPGAPDILCECWKIRRFFFFFLVCFSISREVRTKRQSAFAVYLASVLQFTSEKLFVQINKIKKKNCLWKKNKKLQTWQGEKMQHPIYQSKNILCISHFQTHLKHDTFAAWV